jgi:hypothetical protein
MRAEVYVKGEERTPLQYLVAPVTQVLRRAGAGAQTESPGVTFWGRQQTSAGVLFNLLQAASRIKRSTTDGARFSLRIAFKGGFVAPQFGG